MKDRCGTSAMLNTSRRHIRACFFMLARQITAHHCDVTSALKGGPNFVVAAVDNTRREDNVPTQETDWWNYGGLTREVSLIEVPDAFIDQYDVHLARTGEAVEGWVHIAEGQPGTSVEVEIPELHAKTQAAADNNGRASIHLPIPHLDRWS